MNALKCSVAGCDATSFASIFQPVPEKFKHQAGFKIQSPKFICCSNGHVVGVDYSNDLDEIKRQLELLIKKPAPE
jgi:hypothetical protein